MSGKAAPAQQALREGLWKKHLSRIAAGDQSGLAALYDESSSLVYSIALRVLGDTADAEEVTLDVYTQVWRMAASYDPGRGTVVAWLATQARSRAIDRLRSRAGRVEREQPMVQFFDLGEAAPSPEEQSEARQKRRHIFSALATLSPEQREVIQLAFFSDLSHGELADRLRQPLGTVKTRIRSGMMKLRENLEHLRS
jgi:RNA polymerase sigma-70 factor (ECF subfamily)